MKIVKNVSSFVDEIKKIEFNKDTIYVRSNIRENIECEKKYFEYDEIQYSYGEFAHEINRQLTDTYDYLKKVLGVEELNR